MRQKYNIYSTSSSSIFRDYLDISCIDWEEEKEFTSEQVRAIYMKKLNNLFTSRRCSTKDDKDAQILDIVGVNQNLVDESKKA